MVLETGADRSHAAGVGVDPDASDGPVDRSGAPASRPPWWWTAAPGAIAVGVLALFRLDASSAWLDEAISIGATEQLAETLRETYGTMASYYVILNGWVTLSDSLWWLRALSVLFAVAAVLVFGVVARRIASPRTAMWAGLFLGFSWMMVRYAQEARSFAMVVLVISVSWWALDHIVESPSRPGWIALHLGMGVLSPLTHGLAILAVVVQVVALVAAGVGIRTLLRAAPAVVASVAIGGGLYVYGASDVGTFAEPLALDQVDDLVRNLAAGRFPGLLGAVPELALVALVAYGAVIASVRVKAAARGLERFRALVPVVWGVGTIAALVALSAVRPSMHPRYAIAAMPGIALLQALAALDVQERLTRLLPRLRPVLRLPVIPLAVLFILGVAQIQLHRHSDTTWRQVVEHLAEESQPGDGVYVPGPARMPFDVAWSDLDVEPEIAGVGHSHELGTVQRFGSRVGGFELAEDALAVDRLWVVWWGGSSGVNEEFDSFLARPLVRSGLEVTEVEEFGGARLYLLTPVEG